MFEDLSQNIIIVSFCQALLAQKIHFKHLFFIFWSNVSQIAKVTENTFKMKSLKISNCFSAEYNWCVILCLEICISDAKIMSNISGCLTTHLMVCFIDLNGSVIKCQ